MRIIVAGSRSKISQQDVNDAIRLSGFEITEVVSGTAMGVDRMGEVWAKENNIPISYFPAQWNIYGKRAGYIRNEEMARNAEALIAVWDSESRGTLHMINIAKSKNLKVFIHVPEHIKQ